MSGAQWYILVLSVWLLCWVIGGLLFFSDYKKRWRILGGLMFFSALALLVLTFGWMSAQWWLLAGEL